MDQKQDEKEQKTEEIKQKDEKEPETKEEFPCIDYDKLLPKLPLDNDGFVKSFDLLMDEDIKTQSENKREIQEFFDKYGVVVLRNMLTDDILNKTINEAMDYVELWHPKFKRNDSTTWQNIKGLSQRLGIIGDVCMSKQIALNRCNPKIYKAYQYILDNENIFTNVGRVSYMRPTKGIKIGNEIVNRPEWKSADGKLWLHMDMDPLTNHCTIYGFNPTEYHNTVEMDTYTEVRTQGILALVDCSVNDGGFQCVPGFHKIDKEWIDASGVENIKKIIHDHRYQFKSEDPLVKYATKCAIRKGSLLIWNCRLPHNNFPNDSDTPRMVQYIRYARMDDPAVSFIKLGVENEGPWGRWNKRLVELDVTNDELGEIGRKVYRIDEQEQITQENANGFLETCNIL